MTKDMMVTTITFSNGLRCSWAVSEQQMGMKMPLLRRDGFFATVESKAEQLEILQQALRVCDLRERTREPLPPQTQHVVEMALVLNAQWMCNDTWCTVVFSDHDLHFAHYRESIQRQMDDLRRTAPRESARVTA